MRQHHIILGRNRSEAEAQRDTWLADHPELKIVRVHAPRSERTLLTFIGGRNVPRISIEVEYE
jgi:hypothetical protein